MFTEKPKRKYIAKIAWSPPQGGAADFFLKEPDNKYFRFCRPRGPVLTTQLCCSSVRAANV